MAAAKDGRIIGLCLAPHKLVPRHKHFGRPNAIDCVHSRLTYVDYDSLDAHRGCDARTITQVSTVLSSYAVAGRAASSCIGTNAAAIPDHEELT